MRIFTGNLPDELVRQTLNLKDTCDFNLKEAREKVKKVDWKESILPYFYRPFDKRYICYLPELIDRDRYNVMQHLREGNLGICVTRQLSTTNFLHVFVTDRVADMCFVSIKTKETGYIFPLRVFQKTDNPKKHSLSNMMLLFEPQTIYEVRKPNLFPSFIEQLAKIFKKTITPEQIFFYIYAILHSNIYRTKYAEFLKIDFPRIPFNKNCKLFNKMVKYGERLVNLHLLKSSELDIDAPVAKFRGKGGNKIEKIQYKEEKIHINGDQYFEGITQAVWEYRIGSYQALDKWLKERKNRSLSLEDIKHYCKVVTALKKTIDIQTKIDDIYSNLEEEIDRKGK